MLIIKVLQRKILLKETQYSYLKNSSTEQALVQITEQIYKSIDKSEISQLVLLNLPIVFDSVI